MQDSNRPGSRNFLWRVPFSGALDTWRFHQGTVFWKSKAGQGQWDTMGHIVPKLATKGTSFCKRITGQGRSAASCSFELPSRAPFLVASSTSESGNWSEDIGESFTARAPARMGPASE